MLVFVLMKMFVKTVQPFYRSKRLFSELSPSDDLLTINFSGILTDEIAPANGGNMW